MHKGEACLLKLLLEKTQYLHQVSAIAVMKNQKVGHKAMQIYYFKVVVSKSPICVLPG